MRGSREGTSAWVGRPVGRIPWLSSWSTKNYSGKIAAPTNSAFADGKPPYIVDLGLPLSYHLLDINKNIPGGRRKSRVFLAPNSCISHCVHGNLPLGAPAGRQVHHDNASQSSAMPDPMRLIQSRLIDILAIEWSSNILSEGIVK